MAKITGKGKKTVEHKHMMKDSEMMPKAKKGKK